MAQNDQEGLIREVDDSLRQERMEQLWKKHSATIIIAAIAIVLSVAAYQFYQGWQVKRAGEMGARFLAALQQFETNKSPEAEKTLRDMAVGAPAGYRVLAKFRLAALEAERGKADAAVKLYDDIAKDGQAEAGLRDLARLKAAMLRVDVADFTEMQNRLNDLRDGKNPYHATARELYGLSAWKHAKYAEAEKEFQLLLADLSAPQGVRGRAEVMLQLIAEAMPEQPPADKTEKKAPAQESKSEAPAPKSN